MRAGKRVVPSVLFACVFLFVYTEVLLSPFYPQFFQKVFGVQEFSFTGFYIFVCRLTVVISSPIWGVLARKVDGKRLLIIGQIGTALSCALMALSKSEHQFLMFSILLLAFKSSYLLLYTIMIQAAGNERRKVTGTYHAVFQSAVIASTITSGWVINLAHPLQVFWWIALFDLLQGIVCFAVFRRGFAKETLLEPVAEQTEKKGEGDIAFLVKMALLIFTLHFSVNIIRPFFTVFTEETFDMTSVGGSFLFLIPSLMAVLALPAIKRLSMGRLHTLYKASGLLLFIGLLLQGISSDIGWFILSRCLFGFFLAICQASLDIYLFQRSHHTHYHYSILSSFQNLGLLLAPISALVLVEDYSLSSPFVAASFIFVIHLIIAAVTMYMRNRSEETSTVAKTKGG